MKRALVTGADGFIGSHLVEHLLSRNYSVRALSLYNSFNDWGWLENISNLKEVEVVTGDIRDPLLCQEICKDIDVVFHLAALIAIPYSYRAPYSYVDTNVVGTLNMCQAARDMGVKKFIHTSTSEVYGTAIYAPIDEKHPLQPQSPYSASKISADNMALSYFYSFELPVFIARPFNTYGPRQSARAVIPTMISQILSGKKAINLGATSPVRDFNYVEDTVSGFRSLAESESGAGEVYNIGSGVGVTIGETFNLICEIIGEKVDIVEDSQRHRPKNSEVYKLICSAEKIKQLNGHVPKFDLRKGLSRTIDWFRNTENLKKYKVDIYNV